MQLGSRPNGAGKQRRKSVLDGGVSREEGVQVRQNMAYSNNMTLFQQKYSVQSRKK